MKTFLVTLQRTMPMTGTVFVDAENESEATLRALETWDSGIHWETGYAPNNDVEVVDVEEHTP